MLGWGRLSDHVSRKPLLVLGTLGCAAAVLCFGLSTQFSMVIICRSLQGVFNGNIGITKATVAEITDAANIMQAFSFMPLVWGVYDSVEYVHCFHLFTKPIADWFFKPGDRRHLLSSSRHLAIILWENPIPSQLSLPFAMPSCRIDTI